MKIVILIKAAATIINFLVNSILYIVQNFNKCGIWFLIQLQANSCLKLAFHSLFLPPDVIIMSLEQKAIHKSDLEHCC